MRGLAVVLLLAAGCEVDPCGVGDGACLALHVSGPLPIDEMTVDFSEAVSYHNRWVLPEGARLPLAVGVLLPEVSGTVRVDVVGRQAGVAVAAGAASKAVGPGRQVDVDVSLHALPGTCSDGVQNGSESNTDCGGADCPKCGAGAKCATPRDCASGVCAIGRCT